MNIQEVYNIRSKELEDIEQWFQERLLETDNSFSPLKLNQDRDDVFVYICSLVRKSLSEIYYRTSMEECSLYDCDISGKNVSSDTFYAYARYRLCADNLLISCGLFSNPAAFFPQRRAREDEDAYLSRGKIYYRMASSYHMQIHRRQTALGLVLAKLSESYEYYISLLKRFGNEYLRLSSNISCGQFAELFNGLKEYEKQMDIASLKDQILDLYLEYRKSTQPGIRDEILKLVGTVKASEPGFSFNLV